MMHSIWKAILFWKMADGKIDSTSMPKSLKLNIYIWKIEFWVGFALLVHIKSSAEIVLV